MKTINEFFGMLQDVIAMASIVIHGTKQAAHMYDDVMTSARQQQLEATA